jgi:hypothetical protein
VNPVDYFDFFSVALESKTPTTPGRACCIITVLSIDLLAPCAEAQDV